MTRVLIRSSSIGCDAQGLVCPHDPILCYDVAYSLMPLAMETLMCPTTRGCSLLVSTPTTILIVVMLTTTIDQRQ